MRAARPWTPGAARSSRRRRGIAAAELDDVAGATRRLAALLSAGLTPAQASAHAGVDPVASPRATAWALLAATWRAATEVGAPLAGSLQRLALALEHAASLRRELDIAFAGPAATSRLVAALPAVGLILGLVLGFDTVHVLVATPVGWACLASGLGLMLAARRWGRTMIVAAMPRDLAPGLGLELVAIGMSGGVSVPRAVALAAASLADASAEVPEESRRVDAERLDAVLALAAATGVPVVGLLRSEADRRRSEADAHGRTAAARVAVRLMLPLAVCVLPAFMLLGVAPVLVALFSSTGLGW